MTGQVQVADLRLVPEYCDAVADRIWNAWWRSRGTPLPYIREWVDENLHSTGIPFALVAHLDGRFVGTTSVIESDLEERPDLSPWVAAVWVDEAYRHTGVGATLVRAAMTGAVAVTKGPVYLCAKPALASFYEGMGWHRIAEDVGGLDVYQHVEHHNGVR